MTEAKRDWRQFALLLIDVQKDFWTEQLAQSFAHFPTSVARLLSLCRSEGIEIIHLRASFKPDMSDWMSKYKLRGSIPCLQGTAGVQTLPFALDRPGETVIVKQTFDGFHSPELLHLLERKRKRYVLTAGLLTSVCVLLTTASAAQKGFLTAVVEDCCADQPHLHEQTLDAYPFVFERTKVDLLPEHSAEWGADVKKLDALAASDRGRTVPPLME
jgi:nicotinamidase-related amidase